MLKSICKLFDCTVLEEREFLEIGPNGFRKVYALGFKPDLDAGMCGSVLTDWFRLVGELEQWCKSEEGFNYLNKIGKDMFEADWNENYLREAISENNELYDVNAHNWRIANEPE